MNHSADDLQTHKEVAQSTSHREYPAKALVYHTQQGEEDIRKHIST